MQYRKELHPYQKAESCKFHRKQSLAYLVLPLEITDSELQNDIRRNKYMGVPYNNTPT